MPQSRSLWMIACTVLDTLKRSQNVNIRSGLVVIRVCTDFTDTVYGESQYGSYRNLARFVVYDPLILN